MGNNFFTPDVERGTYERVIAEIASNMNVAPDAFKRMYKIMPSVIKMGVQLDPAESVYKLSPRKGVDAILPNAILLDQNDAFAVKAIGLRFGRCGAPAGVLNNTHGNNPLLTYPDPGYFSGNGTTAGSESAGLQTIVNGTLAFSVNNDAIVDDLPCQEMVYNGDGKYVASPLSYPSYGGSDGQKGYFNMTPQIILDASADNSVQIKLANGLRGNINGAISTGTTESGVRNFLYVFLLGWKIKNAATNSIVCPRV
jgi:hypothetical protein